MLFFNNAPNHITKTTKTWLEIKSIRLMFWPRSESRLIENFWSHIKPKLTGKHFSTTHQLFEAINTE